MKCREHLLDLKQTDRELPACSGGCLTRPHGSARQQAPDEGLEVPTLHPLAVPRPPRLVRPATRSDGRDCRARLRISAAGDMQAFQEIGSVLAQLGTLPLSRRQVISSNSEQGSTVRKLQPGASMTPWHFLIVVAALIVSCGEQGGAGQSISAQCSARSVEDCDFPCAVSIGARYDAQRLCIGEPVEFECRGGAECGDSVSQLARDPDGDPWHFGAPCPPADWEIVTETPPEYDGVSAIPSCDEP